MKANEVKPLFKDFDFEGNRKYWVYYPISRRRPTTTPEPVETFHLTDEASNPLLTEGGDFIDYDFVIPPTPTPTPSQTASPTPTPSITPTLTLTPTPTPSSTAFSPADISGLIYWSDYSDVNNLTLDTSTYDSVESVNDSYSGITIFSQLTKAEQPKYDGNYFTSSVGAITGNTNGGKGLVGTGLTMPSNYTMFVSFKPILSDTSTTTGLSMSDSGAGYGGSWSFRHHQLKTIEVGGTNYLTGIGFSSGGVAFSYPGVSTSPLSVSIGTRYNIGMSFGASGGNMVLNMYNGNNTIYDTQTVSGTGNSGSQDIVVGWDGFEKNGVMEQFMYNRELTLSEIQQVMDYLNSKY